MRARVRRDFGEAVAERLPSGYHRMGSVLLLRLAPELRPAFAAIGEAWRRELGVETVITRVGPVEGEARRPRVEVIAGSTTETEVVEHGVRYRFDAAEIMFATGNRTERQRAGRLVRPGETVIDLFAGIGYFALPAARTGRPEVVWAVERNPIAYRYLVANVRRNHLEDRVRPVLGDNRTVGLPRRSADRLFLGYLPSAVPWVPRALDLARAEGATLHVHLVADVRGGRERAQAEVAQAVEESGGSVLEPPEVRPVKPYGPGREHVVVDVRARSGPGGRP